MTNSNDGDRICSCHLCRSNYSFSMPQEIIESTIKNELVIFAGAGVSTESSVAFQTTFYQDIKDELDITDDNGISFSELMSLYCKMPDGKRKLFQKLWYRFNYVKSFQEVYNFSTRFHRELSTIHHIKEIVTTNWDDYFEEECGAIPIVNSKDFVFWDLPARKVFKLHGCIRNFSSLVITKEDYEYCSKELTGGQLKGSYLKMLLATKKVVFVGYSFGDEDFNQLYSILNSEMKGLLPHSYIITLDSDIEYKLPSKAITPIITDATYFICELKKHMVEMGLMLTDITFEKIPKLLDYTLDIHNSISEKVKPFAL
jgi:NAD-dependent SIR2 family protein deacetylase